MFAQALWATLHGIVALDLTCPVFPTAPLGSIVDAALDAWFGERPPAAFLNEPVAATTAANDILAADLAAPPASTPAGACAARAAPGRKTESGGCIDNVQPSHPPVF